MAKAAPAHCMSCGFYVSLAGALGRIFGACTNAFAPDDGRIVSADHGCGAHSEALVEPVPIAIVPPVVMDDSELELVSTAAHEPGSVEDGAETEPFGHG
jgi:hypothetical protein